MKTQLIISIILLSLMIGCGLPSGSGSTTTLGTIGQKIIIDWNLSTSETVLAMSLCTALKLKEQNYYSTNLGKTLYFHIFDTKCNSNLIMYDIPMQITSNILYSTSTASTTQRFFQIETSTRGLAAAICTEIENNKSSPKRSFQTGFNATTQYSLSAPTDDSITLSAIHTIDSVISSKEEITILTLSPSASQLGAEIHEVKTSTCAAGSLNNFDKLESYLRR